MAKSSKKTRVKPFKPLGNRVVLGTLKSEKKGNNIATDEQIAVIVKFSEENRKKKLNVAIQEMKAAKDLQEAKYRASRQQQLFFNEVRRADLA